MELSPKHPARAKFRFCLPPDSPDEAVVKLNQFYDERGAPPLTFVPYSPAAPRELSEIPPGSPIGPVILPFSSPCSQPDNAAAKGEDVGDHVTTAKFPTTKPDAHRHSGLAGKAGIVAAVHRTPNFLQPATRGAATDNVVGQYALHRHSTETWLMLYRKVHVSAVIESFCGSGWRYKIQPELAWIRSFRKHRHFPDDVFAVKMRASRVLHFHMRMANARVTHSTLWAWYHFRRNFYFGIPPEHRRFAIFCQACLRQFKVTPFWTLMALICPWHPQVKTSTIFYGVQAFRWCKYCGQECVLDCFPL